MSIAKKLSALISGLFLGTIPLSNRNYFVDGNFDSWFQTAPYTNSAYGLSNANMYYSGSGTGGTSTIAPIALTPGQASSIGLHDCGELYAQFVQSVASTGTLAAFTGPRLEQRIEKVKTLNGKSGTYGLWLWSPAAITITQILVYQAFGTGGSPSAAAPLAVAVNWAVGTTPKKFSVRLDVPSVIGKTIGTNANDFLSIGLCLPVGVTFTLNTTQWQLEHSSPKSSSDLTGLGGDPTTFEWRGPEQETSRVERSLQILPYLQNLYGLAGNALTMNAGYRTAMRGAPAASFAAVSSANSSANTLSFPSQDNVLVNITPISTSNTTINCTIYLDARL